MSSLRDRLAAAKQSSRRAGSMGKSLFHTPVGKEGGSGVISSAVVPLVPGKELLWVKLPEFLCGGRVGTGGKTCLRTSSKCDTESHERSKNDLPSDPFLILLVNCSDNRGYENVTLPTRDLDADFITSLLEKTEVNWAQEFEVIKSNGTKSVDDSLVSKDIVLTSRKQRNFSTPSKKNAINDFDLKLKDLNDISELVSELGAVHLGDDSLPINRFIHLIDDKKLVKNLDDVYSQLDILVEHANIVKDMRDKL